MQPITKQSGMFLKKMLFLMMSGMLLVNSPVFAQESGEDPCVPFQQEDGTWICE